MQTVRAVVSTAIADSARVQLVGGMFDLGVPPRVETTFQAQVPSLDEPWRIGAIVGPSGSGKTSIARAAFGKALWTAPSWPARKAIVDCFGNLEVKRITGTRRGSTPAGGARAPGHGRKGHVVSRRPGVSFRYAGEPKSAVADAAAGHRKAGKGLADAEKQAMAAESP